MQMESANASAALRSTRSSLSRLSSSRQHAPQPRRKMTKDESAAELVD